MELIGGGTGADDQDGYQRDRPADDQGDSEIQRERSALAFSKPTDQQRRQKPEGQESQQTEYMHGREGHHHRPAYAHTVLNPPLLSPTVRAGQIRRNRALQSRELPANIAQW
jgi:hypothetical protein